jgi:hypothetical protein
MKRAAAGSPEKAPRRGPPAAAGGGPTSGRQRGGPASGRLRRGPFDLERGVGGCGALEQQATGQQQLRKGEGRRASRRLLAICEFDR